MPADLADSLKADAPLVAATENEEVATLTATIETNLWQGDLETGVGSLSGDQASSEWEERQKSRVDELRSRSLLRKSSPQSVRRFLWPCDSTGGCAQRRGLRKRRGQHGWRCPQPHGNAVGWHRLMSPLPIVETQKSQWNVSGMDRRETGLFLVEKNDVTTVWDPGL